MLKILRTVPFFAPAYGYGGPVVHTYNVSKIQASLGYDIRVFTTNILDNDIISNELPKFETIDKIKIHRFAIKYRLRKSHYFLTPNLPLNFLKYDFDIIHSHSFRTFQTDVATLMAKIRKKPFVFTAHGTLRNVGLFNWCSHKPKDAKIIRLYDIFFKKFFLNAVDKIIVHSNYEKVWTINNGIPENKIIIIPHGVNIKNHNDLNFRKLFLEKYDLNGKIVLYVGRILRNYRNLDHIIKVMSDILKELKDIKLLLIGHSFDKIYENELKQLVKKLKLSNNIIFITHPTREDILGAYQIANVVVFPINNSDSFGIPLLEAGASKCPVISTNRGPAPELIINNKTGILTEIDNLIHLRDSLLKILSDDDLQKKMGKEGYNNIVKNYTWEIITKKINEVYNELI